MTFKQLNEKLGGSEKAARAFARDNGFTDAEIAEYCTYIALFCKVGQ